MPFTARRVSVKEMFAADEVFLASTTAEGLPVVRINSRRAEKCLPCVTVQCRLV
jgi:branched-subunit amino acid aminotransferase/4-amino-4-deoxychorismate lyase